MISNTYQAYRALVAEIGIEDRIRESTHVMGTFRNGVIHHLNPTGLLADGLGTRLLSWRSKLMLVRAWFDVQAAKRRNLLDLSRIERAAPVDHETAVDYGHRRLNEELADCPAGAPASAWPLQDVNVFIGTRIRPQSPAVLVQVPRRESAEICLFSLGHNITPSAVPDGHGLIVAYWEADAAAAVIGASDAEIIARTMPMVHRAFPEIVDQLDMIHVNRWETGLPLTRIGAYQAMAAFNASVDPASPIQLCGDYMTVCGMNSAVESGTAAARMNASFRRRKMPRVQTSPY